MEKPINPINCNYFCWPSDYNKSRVRLIGDYRDKGYDIYHVNMYVHCTVLTKSSVENQEIRKGGWIEKVIGIALNDQHNKLFYVVNYRMDHFEECF